MNLIWQKFVVFMLFVGEVIVILALVCLIESVRQTNVLPITVTVTAPRLL